MLSASRTAFAIPAMSFGSARLRLIDAHSGTVFDGPYRDSCGPISTAVTELDMFLRDRHTGGVTSIDLGVLDFLASVMAAVGEKSAVVLSAYRSFETNERLARTTFGVAENSEHLYGRALDVTFPAAKLADAMAAARAMKRGGVGWYPRSKFIHLDTGPVRNWELGGEGLREQLLQAPSRRPRQKPAVPVRSAQITLGGVKETLVSPGSPAPAGHGRVAGLLQPLVNAK